MTETNHTADMPVAWCCTWQQPAGQKIQGRAYRPRPQQQRHPTRAAAEAHRADLKSRYGAEVVCCITPVFITKKHSDEVPWPRPEGAS